MNSTVRKPVIIDVETKTTFKEFADPKRLGVSVAVAYDYMDNSYHIFFEHDLPKLFKLLEHASYIIGFNSKSFDIPVLQGYYTGNVDFFNQFDMLDDIREKLGKRLALNDLLQATLGKKKTGHGLQAIDYYKQGKLDELAQYCRDDVALTKELFDYGVKFGEVYYLSSKGREIIEVDWKKYMESTGSNDVPLTLGF